MWRSNVVFDLQLGQRQAGTGDAPGHDRTSPPVHQNDNLKAHTDNWFAVHAQPEDAERHIETGFAHAVAVVMATRSYREGKKMYWDRTSEDILDRAPSASASV